MFIVRQDHSTRQWGYEIIMSLSSGGPVGGHVVLDSSFEGFEAPNEVLAFYASLKTAFEAKPPYYKIRKNDEGIGGYQIWEKNPAGLWVVLSESYGWETSEQVKNALDELGKAIAEGMKMINNAPPVKSSKAKLSVEEAKKLNPNFEADTEEDW